MGNVAAKHPMRSHLDGSQASSVVRGFRTKEGRKSSSASSASSSSQDYLDAETDIHSSIDEDDVDLEDIFTKTHEELGNRSHEDAFMKAVLAFCAHMGGRMDSLDNARLYEEFCSYAASHTAPKVSVAA